MQRRRPARGDADRFTEVTDRAHQIIMAARESAAESRRVYVDSVDVLLAMLCEPRGIARNALRHLGIDCEAVERSLRETVSRDETSAAFLKVARGQERRGRQVARRRLHWGRASVTGVVPDSTQRGDGYPDAVGRSAARHLPRGLEHHWPRGRLAALAGGSSGYVVGGQAHRYCSLPLRPPFFDERREAFLGRFGGAGGGAHRGADG